MEKQVVSFFDLLDSDVLELNQRPMTKKPHVPFAGSLKATDIIVFENDGAVQGDLDVVFVHDDFLLIPLADGLQETSLGRHALVQRTVILGVLQLRVAFRGVVENLAFEALG